MELTWPIDTYCWIVYGKCRLQYRDVDKQIFLSTALGKKFTVGLHTHGHELVSVFTQRKHLCFYELFGDVIITDRAANHITDTKLPQQLLDCALIGEDYILFTREQKYCDAGQKIIEAISKLPTPIAEEIIPHLRGSVRMILTQSD